MKLAVVVFLAGAVTFAVSLWWLRWDERRRASKADYRAEVERMLALHRREPRG